MERLKNWIKSARNIVFFGGAGVSTESGIPDFRGENGLYRQKFRYSPETIISHSFFMRDPECFFEFYKTRMLPLDHQPNICHKVLAKWEQQGRLRSVITQNIDGLHQKAGSKRVLELHGSVLRNYCMGCGASYDAYFVKSAPGVPKCSCGGVIKPDVVLYEEPLDDAVMEAAIADIKNADMLIVAGTSLTVYPAAGLLRYFRGGRLVLINRTPTEMDGSCDLVLHQSLGTVFTALDALF